MDLEKLRRNLVEQSPDILSRRGLLEQKKEIIGRAEHIVEDFRSFYDSIHPIKDEERHPSYNANLIEIVLGGQELSPIGKGRYVARLKGFGRKDIMPDFNDSIREGKEPYGWTHYTSAKGFAVSFHFIGEKLDKLISTELYGPGQLRKGEWVYWEDYLNAGNPQSMDRYAFEGGLQLPVLGMRVAGSLRAYRTMDKKYKETLPLLRGAAANIALNPNLVERATQLSSQEQAV